MFLEIKNKLMDIIDIENTSAMFCRGFAVLFATSPTNELISKQQVWKEEGFISLWQSGVAHYGIQISKHFNLYYA